MITSIVAAGSALARQVTTPIGYGKLRLYVIIRRFALRRRGESSFRAAG